MAELEALVTIGTLAAEDEVALDGARFRPAKSVPELRGAFGAQSSPGSVAGKVLLLSGVGLAALVGIAVAMRLAFFVGKLALLAGVGLGAYWLIRRLLRRR